MTQLPSPSSPRSSRSMLKRVGLVGIAALTLAACQHSRSAESTYDPRSLEYEQRHPLTLQQREHTLPLLVGANGNGLTGGDRTALSGFMQSYRSQGEGSLRIRVPQGSMNASAAHSALADIHDVVAAGGGNPSAILVERYEVNNPSAHAPIMVVFDRLEAVTNACGIWSDTFNPSQDRTDFYNFGCASQSNLGAMLADPRDLVRPRGVGYPDAGRRAEVLARYRRGEITATQVSEDRQAAIAEVDQH